MILSHKHRFLFLKTRKTAGTSIELFLASLCGPDDIITPLFTPDEKLRRKTGGMGPQNCYRPLAKCGGRDFLRLLLQGQRRLAYDEHCGYDDVVRALRESGQDPQFLTSYYKFCFERNPWDKLVSDYYFNLGCGFINNCTFPDFLRTTKVLQNHSGRRIWFSNSKGGPVMDFIGRFENLHADMCHVVDRLGMNALPDLPTAKTQFRKDRSHYSKWYQTPEIRNCVQFFFQHEIDHLGYRFEDRHSQQLGLNKKSPATGSYQKGRLQNERQETKDDN